VWQARYEPLKAYGHGIIGNVTGRNTPWRPNAAASLHTTAQDSARFVAAAIAGVGLRPESARQVFSPQARLDEGGSNTATSPPTGRLVDSLAWGLGWGLEREGDGWSVWHWGDNGPMKAYVTASPSRRTGLVIFLNSQNGLAMVPAVLRLAGAGESAAFKWLRIAEPIAALGRVVRTLRERGVAHALDEYRSRRGAAPADPPLGEDTVNRMGYALLRDQRTTDAIAVFELNVEDHPESWNAHDSLGEALAAAGDTARAIAAYERSVQLNPANAGGIEALKKLRSAAAPRH
jgi:hypothetical protein